MRLRQVLAVVAAAIIPLALLAAGVGWFRMQDQRAEMQRDALGRARAAMNAVDSELGDLVAALAGLARSRNLEAGNITAFYEESRRTLRAHPDWLNIGLTAADGTQLFDAVLPLDTAQRQVGDRESFDEVLRTGALWVGNVMQGPATDELAVRIRVPVAIDGKVRYVLSVPLKLEALESALRAQGVPQDWVIALTDRKRNFIVRIPWARPGTPASEVFRVAVEREPEGQVRGRNVDGVDVYTAYVSSELSGWALGIGIPAADFEAREAHWFNVMTAAGVAAGIAALLLASLATGRKKIGV